jgi:tRNA-specific 2-thiouridylase
MVGLSGGVDSAVAALLLQQQGWRVTGLFMKNWEEDDDADHCAAAADLADARAAAGRLGIELLTVNFATEYWDRVFAHFLAEYRAGRTPNPDILCNSEIKFRAFLDYALDRGADLIATGHYARVRRDTAGCHLELAADEGKDQTYFLYRLDQHQLCHSLFPLGGMTKTEVRRLARQAGLPNHARKDSTGICFIGERRFRDFLARFLPAQSGAIETPEGRAVGRHRGLMFYTIGQRQGLGIGGIKGSGEAPWFVVRKDLERNVLVAVQGHDHPLLFCRRLSARQLTWIAAEPPPAAPHACRARLRHRQALQDCRVTPARDGSGTVEFAQPQRAVAPGQPVVLYRGQECVGGGIVEQGLGGSGVGA